MRKEVALLGFFVILATVMLQNVSAAGTISVTSDNGTYMVVSISDANDLYAYEVNFSIDSGSVESVDHWEFLGSSAGQEATYGDSSDDGYLYAFGSRLDNTGTGVDGGSTLFNINYTGSLTLKGHTLIAANGTEDYVEYNAEESGGGGDDGGSGSGGGSSGGGGSVTNPTTNDDSESGLTVIPTQLNIDASVGRLQREIITVVNLGDSPVELTVEVIGIEDVLVPENSEIAISSGDDARINLNIFIEEIDLYTGMVVLKQGDEIVAEIPVVINLRSENFLFDAKITIPATLRSLGVGENLLAEIDLLQVGPQEKIDVVANYIIKDFAGNTILEESETFFVLGEKSLSKEFLTEGLAPGKYVLGLEIVYPGAFAVSSTQFEVVENSLLPTGNRLFILAAVVIVALVVALIAIIWALRTQRKLKRPTRKRKKR